MLRFAPVSATLSPRVNSLNLIGHGFKKRTEKEKKKKNKKQFSLPDRIVDQEETQRTNETIIFDMN